MNAGISLQAEAYDGGATVPLMRASVVLTDVLLAVAALAVARWGACDGGGRGKGGAPLAASACVLLHPTLMLVDHVHFQYNGLLSAVQLGSMLWLVHGARTGGEYGAHAATVLAALSFAALLNLKHLYVYAAPVYAAELLCGYVGGAGSARLSAARCATIAAAVGAVAVLSLGPLLAAGGVAALQAMFGRLFPFGRGLLHAFWAPNAWAVYAALDKTLALLLHRGGSAQLTGGLVGAGAGAFAVLPGVPPAAALGLALAAMAPAVAAVGLEARARRQVAAGAAPAPAQLWSTLPRAVVYANLCGFVFGFHVHEKALLTALLPLAASGLSDKWGARAFVLLSTSAALACGTLLHESREAPLRACFLLVSVLVLPSLALLARGRGAGRLLLRREALYLGGALCVEAYALVGHALLWGERLPFLPLMLISLYAAAGVAYVWLAEMWHFVSALLGARAGRAKVA